MAPVAIAGGIAQVAARVLKPNGFVAIYGPFKVDGKYTTPSNEDFDKEILAAKVPGWGLKDVRDLEKAANKHGILLKKQLDLPPTISSSFSEGINHLGGGAAVRRAPPLRMRRNCEGSEQKRWDGRAAVVAGVGARNGLGAALARRLAREGLLVVLAGRTAERLEVSQAISVDRGGKAEAVATDVTREKDVSRLFRPAAKAPTVELVVYNVGEMPCVPSLEVEKIGFECHVAQSALGGFLVGREAVRRDASRSAEGTIIFTGATASTRARPPFTAFASAKAALRAVAQGLAREFGPQRHPRRPCCHRWRYPRETMRKAGFPISPFQRRGRASRT